MRAYIYLLRNIINGKVYVGKTLKDPEKRLKEHLSDRLKPSEQHRPLYRAMNKYGPESFTLEIVEECQAEEAADKEIYWIDYYNSYHFGYNATKGGDGKMYIDHAKILDLFDNTELTQREIAKECGCCVDTVREVVGSNRENADWSKRLANNENIERNNLLSQPKLVICVETGTVFHSAVAAGNWLTETGKSTSNNSRSKVADVCNGKLKQAYGYHWQYLN